jgi:hypothetical protein
VRVRFRKAVVADASIADLRLEWHGQRLAVPRNWFLYAWPMPHDTALAVDGNSGTQWRSHAPAEAGNFLEVLFDRPTPFDSLSLVSPMIGGAEPLIDVYGLTMGHTWELLPPSAPTTELPLRARRAEASAFIRSMGVRWIVAPASSIGHGPIGRSLLDYSGSWGVDKVEQIEGISLFRLR